MDGKRKYIEFASQALQGGQKNYSTAKRELLAIIFALKRWKHYLFGKRFRVETDHKALTYLHQSTKFMVLDWLSFLLEFDFYITYQKGIANILPNRLSRLYDEDTQRKQQESVEIVFDVRDLEVESTPVTGTKKWIMEFIHNVVGKKMPSRKLQRKLICKLHKESHIGVNGLYQAIFWNGYFWPGMKITIEKVVKGCEECLRYNVGKVGFHPITSVTATLPFDQCAIDFIGPFPTSENSFNYILLIVDIATRFVILRPLQTKEAEEMVWTLLQVFADFGLPKVIQHDRDKLFLNEVMDRVRNTAEFTSRAILRYFPTQNGAAEQYVGEVKRLLIKTLSGDLSNWERLVPVMQLSVNDRILGRHGSSPFAYMFAKKLNGARDYTKVKLDQTSGKKSENSRSHLPIA